jgi:hypothetical protein
MLEQDLIKRLSSLYTEQDTTNFNVLDYVYAFGSPLQALMYSKLFWPEFIEIEDMVFLKDRMEDEDDRRAVLKVLEQHEGNRSKTEQAFNLFEIPQDMFGKKMGETTEEEDRDLAEILVEMWQCRLRMLFPNRSFKVMLLTAEETGGEIGILFYQSET